MSKINYVIIIYAFYMSKIDDDNIIQYSFIFGLFYDFLLDNIVGVNVLFFLALTIFQMRFAVMFYSKDKRSNIALAVVVILIFNIYNLIFFEYKPLNFLFYGAIRFITDTILYLFIFFIKELTGAISLSKR